MLIGFAALLLGGTAHAEPSLSIAPAEILLTPGLPEKIVVTLSGTPAEIAGAKLRILPPRGLTAGSCLPAPAAKGTKGWIVTLKADSSLITSTAVILVQSAPKLLTGSLKVAPAPGAAADTQFKAELAYDGESLFDKTRGAAQLRLTNLSDSYLRLTQTLGLPDFLKQICPDGKACAPPTTSVDLPPRTSMLIPYKIVVETSEQHPFSSGKHEITALVTATRLNAERPWQGSQIVKRELNVGIPGLEGIQSLIQVPSFLLLPGFLICVVAMMTWRLGRPPAPAAGASAPTSAWATVAMSPALWVLAISLSMLMVWAYPTLGVIFHYGRRDLLQGFDLADVIRAWVFSIVIGFLAGNLAHGHALFRTWREARGSFGNADTPAVMLRKMKRQGLSALIVKMVNDPPAGRLFRIASAKDTGKVWAIPAIRYEVQDSFDETGFVDAISNDRINEVVSRVDRGLQQQILRLGWDTVPGGGPRIVDEAIFNKPNQKGLIFDPV